MIKRLELMGDSIMKGIIYEEAEQRYRLYRSASQARWREQGTLICKKAHMGATVRDGLARLARAEAFPEDTLLIANFGGNDCDFDWERIAAEPEAVHSPKVSEETFLILYRGLIEEARRKGARVSLQNLVPLQAERYFETITRGRDRERILYWLGDVSMLYRWQEHYNRLVEGLALETGCPLIDVRSCFLKRHDYASLIGADGIHPSEEGYRLIDEAAEKALAGIC